MGKECSGYKTSLTWDVGVASRGKLRGLSCPVANKNVDGTDVSPSELEKRRGKSSVSKPKKEEPDGDKNAQNLNAIPEVDTVISSASAQNGHAQTYPPPSFSFTSSPQFANGWQFPSFENRMHSRQTGHKRHLSTDQPSIQHLHTSLGPQYDSLNMPNSSRSYNSFSDAGFHSPMEYPHTPASLPLTEQLPLSMTMSFPEQSIAATSPRALSNHRSPIDDLATAASMRSILESAQAQNGLVNGVNGSNGIDTINGNMFHASQFEADTFNNNVYEQLSTLITPVANGQLEFDHTTNGDNELQQDEFNIDRSGLPLVNSRFASPFFTMTPRLQTLMEYYSRNICPHLVAFDGPENPYRKHILQLALDNEGLQNAIAALSMNNFRKRKKQPRQLGFVEEITNAFNSDSLKDWSEPSAEEMCYKQMSIDQLNLRLHSDEVAQDDSVLAMLLILCLFHVCDSGFSQFTKQLAGVQMLLGKRILHSRSDFTRWVEMFFIWFDVMTSAVNDREMQIEGESLAMLDFSANLGALEQYSGCDGRLFKLIARLGRLNVLSQGKQVKQQNTPSRKRRAMSSVRFMHPAKKIKPTMKFPMQKSFDPADYERIDGNGWGTPILSEDEDADGSADESSFGLDNRHDFWMEWHDIRSRLMNWQMDILSITTPGAPNAPTDPAQLDAGQRDLIHINESFRFSALLYTERLAHPLLPSSHDQFQRLVSQVLYHITALPVTSCVNKFLMWPLFIAGTESVDESHREFIRRRCQDLTEESGFFNNISSLWVLEKVWKEVGNNVRGSEAAEVRARRRDSEASTTGRHGQAFRWRKAMDREDGEYIVL